MRVLIFGNGQIGNFHLNHYQQQGHTASIAKGVDITDAAGVHRSLTETNPDVVINTAAATSLEWCGENRLAAFNTNVLGAGTVASACDQLGVYLVHYSSGCIFSSHDGTDAKAENDIGNPSSYYGWTKVWSENVVPFERSDDFRCLILRPRQPVSAQVSPKNMLVKMLTFAKYVDTANSGTVIEDLMAWTDHLVARGETGVFHVANSGYTTPYAIAEMIKEFILPDLEPERITKAELDKLTPNIRVDTVLNVDKLAATGVSIAPYEKRLPEVVERLSKNLADMDKSSLAEIMSKTAAASRQRTVLNEVYASLYS